MAPRMTGDTSELKFQPFAAPSPWQAALLTVPEFPIPPAQLSSYRKFLGSLAETLMDRYMLRHEVLYQTWKLAPDTGADILSAHIEEWPLDFGIGIWPDRKPPGGWTEESFMDAAAAVFRGDEPQFPSHRILLLTGSKGKRLQAADLMRGFGAQIEFFSRQPLESTLARGKEHYLPAIREGQCRKSEIYLPLLDRRSIAAAQSPEQLDTWMCEIEVYLRESAEDKAILLLSRIPLQAILEFKVEGIG